MFVRFLVGTRYLLNIATKWQIKYIVLLENYLKNVHYLLINLNTLYNIKKYLFYSRSQPPKAHEKSHENCDLNYEKKPRRPWEKPTLDSECEEGENDFELFDSIMYSKPNDNELYQRRVKQNTNIPFDNIKLTSQQFKLDKNGFIYSVENPSVVLGIVDIDSNLIEVFLLKKSEENPYQRWMYRPDGSIVLKCRQHLALTVKITPLENLKSELSKSKENLSFLSELNGSLINESQIILQPLIETECGSANQKWFIEATVGLIFAFAPTYDKTFGKF